MIGWVFDRLSHALGVSVMQTWTDLPRASHTHPSVDIDALNSKLDRLEALVARRRLQRLDAESVTVENPDEHDDSA